ncbi:MAG: Radical domain protein [Clostridiales bacterium]|nr:Radical domain protein [Clostridiales bacterium]MDF2987440.1 Radical domain protein [Eubacterium sp.]
MHYEGPIFRPPIEANSLLLQVTVGCAHNKCTFCNMYQPVCFRKEPLEQIEEDLREARSMYRKVERVFLVNGDAFVLKADYLKAIALKVKEYIPECNTITMYASVRNIMSKTDEELKELRALGINDLYLGIESGWNDVVDHINKGWTIPEAKEQAQRLRKANINWMASFMLGIAGKGLGEENAKANAEFLNEAKPNKIWFGTLAVFEGTKLYEEVEAGTFVEPSEKENLLEMKTVIENIKLENVPFYGVHSTNVVPVIGTLPRDREKMLQALDAGIKKLGEEKLSKTFRRTSL